MEPNQNNNQQTQQVDLAMQVDQPSVQNNSPTDSTQPVAATQPVPTPVHTQNPVQTQVQSQANPTNPSPDLRTKKSKFPKKILIIGFFGFLVLVIVMMILSTLLPGIVPNPVDVIPQPQESIEPSPTPTATPVSTSPYSDDPDVLAVEEAIKEFDQSLNSVNLREDNLRIPTLEWEVEF